MTKHRARGTATLDDLAAEDIFHHTNHKVRYGYGGGAASGRNGVTRKKGKNITPALSVQSIYRI